MNNNQSFLFHSEIVSTNRIIYTASDFSKRSLLYLQEVGSLAANSIHSCTRVDLQSFLFFCVIDGTGTLNYDGKTYKLSQGDCVFIDCSKGYTHKTGKDLWTLKWIHFNGKNMNDIYNKYIERNGKNVIHSSNFNSYINMCDSVFSIAKSKSYIKDIAINEKLSSLITLLMEKTIRKENFVASKYNELDKIKAFLDSNYKNKISLNEISNKFFINKFYLIRIFKAEYGITIYDYLNQLRITKAKELLRFTNESISKIGRDSGFPDANYFSRKFKQLTGETPKEYKSKW